MPNTLACARATGQLGATDWEIMMTGKLFDCAGKVTLVTGGNGGIGLGFARGVAKMGGDIAIWARNAEKNGAEKGGAVFEMQLPLIGKEIEAAE